MSEAPLTHVLIVTDDPRGMQATRDLLMTQGFDVSICAMDEEGWARAVSCPAGAVMIVMDHPAQKAKQLVDHLRQRKDLLIVPVDVSTVFRPMSSSGSSPQEVVQDTARVSGASTLAWAVLAYLNHAMGQYWKQMAEQTRQTLAERSAALHEESMRFQQLSEHIHQVFWVLSADRQELVYVNPAYETVWGRSRASLSAQPMSFLSVVHPDDRDRILSAWSRQCERAWTEEFRISREEGVLRWIRSSVFPVTDEQGVLTHLAVLSEDITDRKRAEEVLEKMEQQYRQASKLEALGTLAGGIAHDFNNILTAILGYTELALATVPKESRAQRNLQEVLTAGHRAKHLIQQILTFSRQGGTERTPVQLEPILRDAFTFLRASLPATIDIRMHLLSEAMVLADPAQMNQVVVNLCSNAECAMREHGGVLEILLEDVLISEQRQDRVSTLPPGPYVRLTVRDTGHGIAPELLDRIFDPFFTTKQTADGSGMGLAVVHGIVTGHGGTIHAESALGRGTTVTVYLPAIPTPQPEKSASRTPSLEGKESILFVDDEEALVRLGQELLSLLGYQVEVRTNSLEALELFRENPDRFDLVITDQTMPLMTGEQLARELLKIRPGLPIILCTGFSHTVTAEKAKALGIRAYLMKPLAIRDLAPIVRHVLDEDPIVLSRNRERENG
ncbi:MAG: response regulator [Nitrospirae bacterium]|nr:MAG: response regulator [Nitrospirota bacterium]